MKAEYIQAKASFLCEVNKEIDRAVSKFPDSELSTIALMEEVGELAKALLQEDWQSVYKEAVQVATMAARVAIEGDASIDAHRISNGLDKTPLPFPGKD